MSWEALTAVSTAFTGLVILVTALVGVNQLAQMREQRRDGAAVELMRSLQDSDYARAFSLIMSLPAGISSEELRRRGHEYAEAATILTFRFEMLGVLVYRGTISFGLTEELVGGAVVSVWHRMKTLVQETRDAQDWPMYLEWFQWMAEQFEGRGRLLQVPAHERHRGWSPKIVRRGER
jgi:hypothetical protein